LLDAPLDAWRALADTLADNLTSDFEQYDIRDAATVRDRCEALAALAAARGRWQDVACWTQRVRDAESKPGAKRLSGLVTESLAEQRQAAADSVWLAGRLAERLGALPWNEVEDAVRAERAQYQTFAPDLVKGMFQAQFDPVAAAGDGSVPEEAALALIQARVLLELLTPDVRDVIVTALQELIDSHADAEARPDIWTPRQFSIPGTVEATPVTVGVWDSGVDLDLFQAALERGLAFDSEFRPCPDLLRPLGEAQARWPALRHRLTGFQDLGTGIDSPAAREVQAEIATLKPEAVQDYMEDMSLASLYAHGTHVAGIAVAGNPFARVFAASMHFHHLLEPQRPSEEQARRLADAFVRTVEAFAAAGVRVVNMSWVLGPKAEEDALAYHGMGDSPEARQGEARRLFGIARDGLSAALLSAPDILFVAGSGNSDNSADFDEFIPSSLRAPNLVTVGAVDATGRETAFSTFGETVAVHANGFAVDSDLPGGGRAALSGTSMAAPQVANLAAKLFVLRPGLTAVEVKDLIVRAADQVPNPDGTPGRVRLANPRRSAELAGVLPHEIAADPSFPVASPL
jgi:subtilisin family serine protease